MSVGGVSFVFESIVQSCKSQQLLRVKSEGTLVNMAEEHHIGVFFFTVDTSYERLRTNKRAVKEFRVHLTEFSVVLAHF